MSSKLIKAATKAIRDWCRDTGEPAEQIRHVHPRAYVVGRAAPLCLIVAEPWVDSEPQCQEFNRLNPLATVHRFDARLDAGMWCTTGYVVRNDCSETVAIPVVPNAPHNRLAAPADSPAQWSS